MKNLSRVLRTVAPTFGGSGRELQFWCPGCKDRHSITVESPGARWTWDGNAERPTIKPSVLVRSGHYASHFKPGDSCWCTYNAEHPDEPASLRFKCEQCHSFVRAGRIQFLADCTHALAGQTVPLPDFPEDS